MYDGRYCWVQKLLYWYCNISCQVKSACALVVLLIARDAAAGKYKGMHFVDKSPDSDVEQPEAEWENRVETELVWREKQWLVSSKLSGNVPVAEQIVQTYHIISLFPMIRASALNTMQIVDHAVAGDGTE